MNNILVSCFFTFIIIIFVNSDPDSNIGFLLKCGNSFLLANTKEKSTTYYTVTDQNKVVYKENPDNFTHKELNGVTQYFFFNNYVGTKTKDQFNIDFIGSNSYPKTSSTCKLEAYYLMQVPSNLGLIKMSKNGETIYYDRANHFYLKSNIINGEIVDISQSEEFQQVSAAKHNLLIDKKTYFPIFYKNDKTGPGDLFVYKLMSMANSDIIEHDIEFVYYKIEISHKYYPLSPFLSTLKIRDNQWDYTTGKCITNNNFCPNIYIFSLSQSKYNLQTEKNGEYDVNVYSKPSVLDVELSMPTYIELIENVQTFSIAKEAEFYVTEAQTTVHLMDEENQKNSIICAWEQQNEYSFQTIETCFKIKNVLKRRKTIFLGPFRFYRSKKDLKIYLYNSHLATFDFEKNQISFTIRLESSSNSNLKYYDIKSKPGFIILFGKNINDIPMLADFIDHNENGLHRDNSAYFDKSFFTKTKPNSPWVINSVGETNLKNKDHPTDFQQEYQEKSREKREEKPYFENQSDHKVLSTIKPINRNQMVISNRFNIDDAKKHNIFHAHSPKKNNEAQFQSQRLY